MVKNLIDVFIQDAEKELKKNPGAHVIMPFTRSLYDEHRPEICKHFIVVEENDKLLAEFGKMSDDETVFTVYKGD